MVVAVIDGQGGGLGKTIVSKIKASLEGKVHLVALGTNGTAAANMLKAGAERAVVGEKSICKFCLEEKVDCIVGPIGILCSGGIRGEITSNLSAAFFKMECKKYIIPLKVHGFFIPGTTKLEIKEMLSEIILDIKSLEDE